MPGLSPRASQLYTLQRASYKCNDKLRMPGVEPEACMMPLHYMRLPRLRCASSFTNHHDSDKVRTALRALDH